MDYCSADADDALCPPVFATEENASKDSDMAYRFTSPNYWRNKEAFCLELKLVVPQREVVEGKHCCVSLRSVQFLGNQRDVLP